MHRILLFAILATLCAPAATATDPFRDQVCVPNACVGAGSCVETTCVPSGCPVLACRADIGPHSRDCAFNTTIDGRTCAYRIAFETNAEPLAAGVAFQSSNGSVHGSDLDNVWVSPGVEAHATVAGIALGQVYAHAYRSDIETEGPRGGPLAGTSRSDNHTWTQIGVSAGHYQGPMRDMDVTVGVEFLDNAPESCFVRSGSGTFRGFECPRLGGYYPPVLP